MIQFTPLDKVDATLHDIKAFLQIGEDGGKRNGEENAEIMRCI